MNINAVRYHSHMIPKPTVVIQTAIAKDPMTKIFLLPTILTTNAPRIANTAHPIPINIVPTSGDIGNAPFVSS